MKCCEYGLGPGGCTH